MYPLRRHLPTWRHADRRWRRRGGYSGRNCNGRWCCTRGGSCGWRGHRSQGSNGSFRRNYHHCGRAHRGHRSRRHQSWRRRLRNWLGRHRLRGRDRNFFFCFNRRLNFDGLCRRRLRHRARRRMFGCFLLLRDGAQHVAWTRNMRQIDLGFDLVFGVRRRGTRSSCRGGSAFGAGAKMLADQFGFVFLQRTRVRLLLRDTHRGQHVKNLFALDFQLTGQIIDSNLHPLSFSFSGPARLLRSNTYARISPSRNPCRTHWRDWQSSRFRSGRRPRLAVFPKSTLLVFGSFFRRWLLCFSFSRRLLGFFGGRHFGRLGFRG